MILQQYTNLKEEEQIINMFEIARSQTKSILSNFSCFKKQRLLCYIYLSFYLFVYLSIYVSTIYLSTIYLLSILLKEQAELFFFSDNLYVFSFPFPFLFYFNPVPYLYFFLPAFPLFPFSHFPPFIISSLEKLYKRS